MKRMDGETATASGGQRSWGGGNQAYQAGAKQDYQETKKMIAEAERTAAQSHAAMKRMIALTDETQQIASGTMTQLEQQGEQIRRMQDDVDNMEVNFDKADRELKTINSIWGQLGNAIIPYKRKDRETNSKVDKVQGKEDAKRDKVREKERKKEEKKQKKQDKKKKGLEAAPSIPAEIRVLSPEAQQQVHETDEMIDQLGVGVANLKMMATRMGDELTTQNNRLDVLNQSIENSDNRMRKTNHQVKRMI